MRRLVFIYRRLIISIYFKSHPDSNSRGQVDKSGFGLSDTLSTSKDNDNALATESSTDYNRQSQDMYMPPSVEDINDSDEHKHNALSESGNEFLSPEILELQKRSPNSGDQTEGRLKSASSSRPKTAHSSQNHSETKSSRSDSTASDDTSALLRSDNDNSPTLSDDEVVEEKEPEPVEPSIKSDRVSSHLTKTTNTFDEENELPQIIEQPPLPPREIKGEYDPSQVLKSKESFQPIINEAASYGHLDIVRDLIKVTLLKFYMVHSFVLFFISSVVKVYIHKMFYNVRHFMKHV